MMRPSLTFGPKVAICKVNGVITPLPDCNLPENAEVLERLELNTGTPFLAFNEHVRVRTQQLQEQLGSC
jgi:hypothetical protein